MSSTRSASESSGLAASVDGSGGAVAERTATVRPSSAPGEAEIQPEALRVFRQITAGVAHDINNALTPGVLSVEALLDEAALDLPARGHLDRVARSLDKIAATVARLQAFSGEPATRRQLRLVPVNELVRQVIELTRAHWSDIPRQEGHVIDVETDLAAGLPAISGVEGELRTSLINLVLNAVGAMPAGGTLTLRTSAGPAAVQIDVVDTGVGMDEATRQRCIEPYFTTRNDRGAGLGLAAVYGIARRHRGRITIESGPGRGTRVGLLLPIAAPVADEAGPWD